MRVLIGCESSGTVRDAFAELGWDAWSCDLLPAVNGGKHIQGDVLDAVRGSSWDLFIVHPPCTYLTNSAEWAYRDVQTKHIKSGTLIGAERRQARRAAVRFALDCYSTPVPFIALENPVGHLSRHLGKPAQIIQPNQFGEDASKGTCLWLKGLPWLIGTRNVEPRIVVRNGRIYKRWANQTDSGQNRLPPSADRWRIRSVTYPGIADAMADQWTRYIKAVLQGAA
jgi:hypothetical protein